MKMTDPLDPLKEQIIQAFQDKWQLNDEAHREKHFEEVYQCGLHLNQALGLNYDPKLILFAAYFHDLFSWSRVNHHEMSSLWIGTTDHPLIQNNLLGDKKRTLWIDTERGLVAWACAQHRASFKGQFASPFSELMNAADRGFPKDPGEMLERAFLYRKKNHPEEPTGVQVNEAIKHLKEKFGHNGYARYPSMYISVFGDQLQELKDKIMEL